MEQIICLYYIYIYIIFRFIFLIIFIYLRTDGTQVINSMRVLTCKAEQMYTSVENCGFQANDIAPRVLLQILSTEKANV